MYVTPETRNENFNLYEAGTSDPNNLRPREFKHPYGNVPVDLTKSAYDQLHALTV